MLIYNKQFTGELKKKNIRRNPTVDNSGVQLDNVSYNNVSILPWREVARKHLPKNAVIETAEFEFRCEYLHLDFNIPSRTIVPNTQIPEFSRRSTNLQKQVGTVEFKNKFNPTTGHAFELRLLQYYDSDFSLTVNNLPYIGANIDSYHNDIDNTIVEIELDYPISEYIFNNRIPGFIDLIPYLIKNGTLFFGDIKQELILQVIPALENKDLIAGWAIIKDRN